MSRVLVTGGASGLGAALVERFAARGDRVLSTDLSGDAAAPTAGAPDNSAVVHRRLDVRSDDDWESARAWVESEWGGLDVLVNNAGIGATGHFMDSDPATLRAIFETNYFALCEITRLCIPVLKAGTTPAIVNISSIAGRRAIPARGLTNVGFPLQVAARELARRSTRDARVVLLSDCVHNAGPDPRPFAARLPRLDVLLDTVGEHDLELGRELAATGRGRLLRVRHHRDVAPALSRVFAA